MAEAHRRKELKKKKPEGPPEPMGSRTMDATVNLYEKSGQLREVLNSADIRENLDSFQRAWIVSALKPKIESETSGIKFPEFKQTEAMERIHLSTKQLETVRKLLDTDTANIQMGEAVQLLKLAGYDATTVRALEKRYPMAKRKKPRKSKTAIASGVKKQQARARKQRPDSPAGGRRRSPTRTRARSRSKSRGKSPIPKDHPYQKKDPFRKQFRKKDPTRKEIPLKKGRPDDPKRPPREHSPPPKPNPRGRIPVI